MNVVSVDTTRHPVHSVSVYQSDRAEIRRLLPVDLKTGQNEVCIERLPNCLDRESIRVEGLGNAVIFDVIYHSSLNDGGADKDTPENKAYIETGKRISKLQTEKTTVEEQIKMLDSYSTTMKADRVDHSKLASFLKLYEERKRKLNESLQSLDEKIQLAEETEKEQKETLLLDDASKKRGVKVTVVVLADEDGPAELSLSYGVTGASWSPTYDIRANLGTMPSPVKDSKDATPSPNNSLIVHYRASITQATGEDWTNVALDLSTASPHLGTEIPALTPQHISIPAPPPPPQNKRKSMRFSTRSAKVEEREESDDDMGFGLFDDGPPQVYAMMAQPALAPPPRLKMVESRAVEGAVSTNFVISGLTSVPTDPDDSHSTYHKVTVAEFDLEPKLEWIAVPKKQTSVFLRCHLKNTSPYVLLPGPSSVFMDGNFVCKSSVPLVSPQETFSTSLGVDPALRITYHPLIKKSKNATGSKFLALQTKTDVTSHIQRVSIKNTRLADIELSMKDQIPTSVNADYKVILVEPTLKDGQKEWASLRNGVKIRWTPNTDDDDESDLGGGKLGPDSKSPATNSVPGEDGMVEWGCEIGAGKTVDITLAWDIAVPRGSTWVTY
ncbi:hypothetical protein FRB94_011323 [Tulasnella sp. JGI-2019a]|nr:hypothetical protein FRB93_003563 [Tulasnella sp. JGI-2019a]KAG8992754.1 hypothetical protein FRB94_011323 [Tulasnella sp. JGI-2019a]KAG9037275.1 hypothetical protein FRB95_006218 [Tulasnella sp. JGI-2019a]